MKTQHVIMCIDDDEFQLELVSDMFRDLTSGNIYIANSGMRALTLYDHLEPKPDLVLCDLSMPDMDGIEILRHLSSRGYRGGIAVLSGMEEGVRKAADTLARAYSLNMLGIIKKPPHLEDLTQMLHKLQQHQPTTRSCTEEKMLTPEELRQGLANGCVDVMFQPKVAVHERRMVGVECLARWRHPMRGVLSPNTFISVAERHGLIDELTMAVLRRGVGYLAEWRKQGMNIRMAINLSASNLDRLDLPERMYEVIKNAGIKPQWIDFEITESGLMNEFHLCLDILTRLRLHGFGLSVDDFGTGYSSLEKLKQIPFSELKVDRAFVNGASHDATTRAILESSVQLGINLGLNLVAEGVETQQDWDLVAKLGCNEVQGYFVAKPLQAMDLLNWKMQWESLAGDANALP